MTARQGTRRLALPLVIAFIIAACSAPATPDGASTATSSEVPAAATASAGALAEPSAPVIDLVDPAGSMVAAELALLAEDRNRAGLINLGPGALDLAAAIDASQARVLADMRADAAAGILAGQVASSVEIGPLAPEPGFNSMLVWATLITTLGDFARDPKSGTVNEKPEIVEIAGNTGTITTTMTVKAVVSGSRLSVDITIKSKGQVVDKSTGATLYSIDSIATGHVDVDFCPDASGQAPANVKLTSSEIYVQGGGSAKGVSKEFSGNATINVGDDANISRVEGAAQASEESKGGVPAAGSNESDLPVSTRQASDNIANDGSGRRLSDVPRNIQFGGEGTTPEDQVKLWGSMSLFVETMVTAAAKEAEKLWKEGKCVELLVDPEGGDVEPDEVTSVTAKLRHKIEGSELDKPVEATLTGVKSIDPAGEKQPAPATVTYTAGPNDGDVGRIAFKSVSNRGIAEKTVTFTVGGRSLKVSINGKMTTSLGGISYVTSVSVPAVVLSRQADGTYLGSGPATGTVTIPIPDCRKPYNMKGTMTFRAAHAVVEDAAVAGAWTLVSAESSDFTTEGPCAKVYLGAFFETGDAGPTAGFMDVLGEVEFPKDGGTKHVQLTKAIGPSQNVLDATVKAEVISGSAP